MGQDVNLKYGVCANDALNWWSFPIVCKMMTSPPSKRSFASMDVVRSAQEFETGLLHG